MKISANFFFAKMAIKFFPDSGIPVNFFSVLKIIWNFFLWKHFWKFFLTRSQAFAIVFANSFLIHREYLPSQDVEKCQTTSESGLIPMPGTWSIRGSIWAPITFFRIQILISHRVRVNLFKKYRSKRLFSKTERFKPNKICKNSWLLQALFFWHRFQPEKCEKGCRMPSYSPLLRSPRRIRGFRRGFVRFLRSWE